MKERPLHLPRVLHPGEILNERFLLPYELSQFGLASALRVSPRRVNEIVLGKRGISADTALRLGLFFENDPEYWMDIQAYYELTCARLEYGDRLRWEIGNLAQYV